MCIKRSVGLTVLAQLKIFIFTIPNLTAYLIEMPRDVETTLNFFAGTLDGDALDHYVSPPSVGKPSRIEIASIAVSFTNGRNNPYRICVDPISGEGDVSALVFSYLL